MRSCLLAALSLAITCPSRAAGVGGGDARSRVSLNTTLKLSALTSHHDADHILHESDTAVLGLSRLRLDLALALSREADARIAYEVAGRWMSRDNLTTGAGILPPTADVPFRFAQLHDTFAEDDRATCSHELDRAYLSFHPAWGEVTVGRQAIGLGRGQLFSAVDLFSPFSPLEVDREWRRGVDAIRAEYSLSATTSIEGILVGGESADDSALVVRARGYVGNVDAEILAGRRGEDDFLAAATSAAVADAEIHGEVAVFRIPEPHPQGQDWGDDRLVPKLVVGSSYTFAFGNGLTLLAEYHYSGFGMRDTSEAAALFARPEYLKRLLRGDTQILGRNAVGCQASYPLNPALTATLTVVLNPDDGSGTVYPAMRCDLSRTASLTVTGFLPWGPDAENGLLQSEHGGSPTSAFLQLSLYF